jgi:hypothetical protein
MPAGSCEPRSLLQKLFPCSLATAAREKPIESAARMRPTIAPMLIAAIIANLSFERETFVLMAINLAACQGRKAVFHLPVSWVRKSDQASTIANTPKARDSATTTMRVEAGM